MANLIKVHCKNCNKVFLKDKGHYKENIKLGHNFYCSKRCELKFKTKRKTLKCENCGKAIKRQLSKISDHNYCSKSCAAAVNNKKFHKKKIKLKTCAECGKQYKKNTNNIKYCSLSCRRKAEQKNPEELLKIIKEVTEILKRVPARREINKIHYSCRKIFGSWNNAVIAAGFQPNRSHNQRMYKRVNTIAIDGHLCDSISEALIDNWLYKNKISHERNVHYPKTNHRADWAILFKNQKIFIEYFGLVNDSSRYDRCVKEKKKLCKNQNISLIAIYPRDLYPKNHLENNLKNKFKNYLPN
ncbi:MAG: hypothetical protein NTY11_00245 [Candidatus Parcubacteria bacterium]|nr:hypothetical protein [Candidatus Parcubacteria bacterium]